MDRINLLGSQVQNKIATNLFPIGMYIAAKKHGVNIFQESFLEQLKKIQDKGYKLAIVSGVRENIISGMFEIVKNPLKFDYIYGQPPILGINNKDQLARLQEKGSVGYVIGDKLPDLENAPAKKIFVK